MRFLHAGFSRSESSLDARAIRGSAREVRSNRRRWADGTHRFCQRTFSGKVCLSLKKKSRILLSLSYFEWCGLPRKHHSKSSRVIDGRRGKLLSKRTLHYICQSGCVPLIGSHTYFNHYGSCVKSMKFIGRMIRQLRPGQMHYEFQ